MIGIETDEPIREALVWETESSGPYTERTTRQRASEWISRETEEDERVECSRSRRASRSSDVLSG